MLVVQATLSMHSPLVVQSSSLSLSDESDEVWSLRRRGGSSLVNSGGVWGVPVWGVTVEGAVVWSTVELGGAGCEGV